VGLGILRNPVQISTGASGSKRFVIYFTVCKTNNCDRREPVFVILVGVIFLVSIRAILITKMKTRTKMITVRILKLKLKYSKKLKLYKNYIDSWLNELTLELNNAKTEMN